MGGIAQALEIAKDMPFEMLLTNYLFAGVPQRVGALYFLAAMVVVFPAFGVLCQCKNHTIRLGIALYAIIFYYHDIDWANTVDYPQVLLRAFCGMCMGIVVHYFVKEVDKKVIPDKWRWPIGIFGNFLLLTSIGLSGVGINDRRVQLLCIFFGTVAVLTKYTPFYGCSNKYTDLASKISMVIYIFHWTIAELLNPIMSSYEMKQRMTIYYLTTVVVSMMMLWVNCTFKRYKFSHNK